jgi:hypothetical protein
MATLESMLNDNGLGEWAATLEAERITLAHLHKLTNEDLKDIGLPLGARKDLLELFGTATHHPAAAPAAAPAVAPAAAPADSFTDLAATSAGGASSAAPEPCDTTEQLQEEADPLPPSPASSSSPPADNAAVTEVTASGPRSAEV